MIRKRNKDQCDTNQILVIVENKNDLYVLYKLKDEESKTFSREINTTFQFILVYLNITIT